MKQIRLIGLTLLMMVVFVACAPAEVTEVAPPVETTTDEVPAQDKGLKLTLEQLKEYDGEDGRPAYVAVDGIIYDVSDSNFWKNGAHNGFSAGNDLTDAIKTKSPHGVVNLERVPAIGELVD